MEILRVWIANKGQHVSLRAGIWEDPASWGIMLADLARHIANMFHQDAGMDTGEALVRIGSVFAIELTSPTDEPTGDLSR